MHCPVCHRQNLTLCVSEEAIQREIRTRTEFVQNRIGKAADPAELKDLIDFMHGSAAPLYTCPTCDVIVRDEHAGRDAASYEADPNDPDLMRQLLPRYAEAFRRKEVYRAMVRPHARVLELGTHLGAFLQVAEEWNLQPDGLDVGEDTAEFVRRQGFRVRRTVVEEADFADRTFEAVFVWNCFEQLTAPQTALRAIHRLLSPFGLLVVRVPNAWFYARLRHRRALAYNNLLGFPYLHGYTAQSLHRLVTAEGFELVRAFNSELVTLPFADPRDAIIREEREISRAVANWSSQQAADQPTLTGPWIELAFRKINRPSAPLEFPAGRIDTTFLPRAA